MEQIVKAKTVEQIVTEQKAAEELKLAVQTLRNWRHQRRGPAYLKFGRSVRYKIDDLLEYKERHRVDPEKAA
jgi:hypothetical protein